MGKALCCLAAAMLCLTSLLVCHQIQPVLAQQSRQASSTSCSSAPVIAPMQGHYTGTWHSDGDYHFSVFSTDLELKLTIDGTLDTTVDAHGNVTGTATGNVQAPIYDYGRKDISSGIGTISGQITGLVTAGGSLLLLPHPVIDMHWGTFGGHAVERFITMPDFSFSAGTVDCISAGGTIAETGFPEQNVVADGQGQVTQAPGIGSATGNWQLRSDQAAVFGDLSNQVDAFIASANALLDSPASPPDAGTIQQTVIDPFMQLRDTIQKNPGVARCLLARLASWEDTAIPKLFAMAASQAQQAQLVPLRTAERLQGQARVLNVDCNESDPAAPQIQATQNRLLADALRGRDWPSAALITREILLVNATGAGTLSALSTAVNQALSAGSDQSTLLATAQFAAASGDLGDARGLQPRLAGSTSLERTPAKHKPKSKKKHKSAPKHAAKPSPTPVPTPATKSLRQILQAGLPVMDGSVDGAAIPTFTWAPVPGAAKYVIAVLAPDGTPVWIWAGTGTSVRYGDTALDGLTDAGQMQWPIPLPSGYAWTGLAISASGSVIGIRLPPSI